MKPGLPPATAVVRVDETAPGDWDERIVDVAGGDVHQSRLNAEHRASQGWQPSYLTFDDGRAALVLLRRRPPLPGFMAYAPRGPVPAGDGAEQVAARVIGLAAWARGAGARVLAADPIFLADAAYERALTGAGFHEIDELQAERHRMILTFPPRATVETVLVGVAKATRQRIRAAERSGTLVAEADDDASVERFAGLYAATARRRRFWIGRGGALVAWWRRLLAAKRGLLLVARHDDRIVGGLLLYRQGGGLATAVSADDATTRDTLPGTMHLLRWSAIRLAIEAGHGAIDLGGVDLPGARRVPEPGEPTYGLYEHKRAFGAVFSPHAAAHETILRPWVQRSYSVLAGLRGVVRGRRSGGAPA